MTAHIEKNVKTKATQKALVSEYQNLNSGSLRKKTNRRGSDCPESHAAAKAQLSYKHQRKRFEQGGSTAACPLVGETKASEAKATVLRWGWQEQSSAGRCIGATVEERSHLRMKGRNSSSLEVGSVGPSVSGSICGERNPIRRFRM